MDRIEYLKWLMAESLSTTQQLMAWLQRAKRYTPEMKEHRDGVQIEENGIIVGLRQRTNLYNGDCLTIHVVQLPEKIQNKGWFKSFLKLCCKSNPWNDVVIEDVKNPYLLAFCQKHKFEVQDDFYPDTYIVNSEEIMALEIPPLKRYEDYL
ncbi:hypothetical protein [Escherichia coli]|uniref:hypothetical protein n=1 Tax=Escherichia coli TaxID=562 RepID=UPI0009340EEE|nr:hypothetical protein [Escherichia coli]EEM5981988.1 hypothetical protein [Salmonella enterica subsp. enterica serovar Enteritidis]EKY8721155.1 hypothetical protein [Salmonella enterica]HCM6817032.1 hypothetical protein [Klebsiella pneumoniae]MBQ4702629.1 hypothetical protein [Escherichia coli]MCS0854449.1 hypothetical protein [Escherichia coli]